MVTDKGVVFSPTIHHSGSNFIRRCIGNKPQIKIHGRKRPQILPGMLITAHFRHDTDGAMPLYLRLAKRFPTVIPLRHPAMIATSHKKRDPKAGTLWLYKWVQMCQVPAFHFPIETMPFDELEEYLGRKVRRDRDPVKTIGDYPEKHSLEAARKFLKDDWWAVEAALNTDIGRKYYGDY